MSGDNRANISRLRWDWSFTGPFGFELEGFAVSCENHCKVDKVLHRRN